MPNYCNYDMHIRGTKDKIQKFCDWARATYDYTPDNYVCETTRPNNEDEIINTEHHLGYRVFDFQYDQDFLESCGDNNEIILYTNGYCAWSVESCMFANSASYIVNTDVKNSNVISLPKACEALHLDIELFSAEPGMLFSEHYLIKDGKVIMDDVAGYIEVQGNQIDDFQEYTDDVEMSRRDFETIKAKLATMAEDDILIMSPHYKDGDWTWEIL